MARSAMLLAVLALTGALGAFGQMAASPASSAMTTAQPRGQVGGAPPQPGRQPPERQLDARTGAFCYKSSAECERSTSTPCGLREGPRCADGAGGACANAGAGFAFYCPSVATQVDAQSGARCYRRKVECEGTTANSCNADNKPCVISATLCGQTDIDFNYACPSGAAIAAAAAALPPPCAPPPLPAALPALRAHTLALRSLALLVRSSPSLLALSVAAAAAEQAVAFASFALLALLGVPDASFVNLAVGLSGIAAGYAVGAFAKGAAYLLIRDADAAASLSPPPSAASPSGIRPRFAALRARAATLRAIVPHPGIILAAELRRLLSIAWQGFLTFPVPVFALPKMLDLALLMPLLTLERRAAGDEVRIADAMARSGALLRGRRRTLAGAASLLALCFVAVALAGAAALLAAVPSLGGALLPLPLEAGTQAGDVVASFASGAAFSRVFEHGTAAQQGALSAGLAAGSVLRWAAVAAVRCLAYAAWREAAARGPQPPRAPHPLVAVVAQRAAAARTHATARLTAAAKAARALLPALPPPRNTPDKQA